MEKKFRSALSNAKNTGSAHSGVHHWWHQRFTAVILALMVLWFFLFVNGITAMETSALIAHLQKPLNIIILLIFSITAIYHSVLGMQVVIEDYVHCRIIRLMCLLFTQIFAIFTGVAFSLAVIIVMIL